RTVCQPAGERNRPRHWTSVISPEDAGRYILRVAGVQIKLRANATLLPKERDHVWESVLSSHPCSRTLIHAVGHRGRSRLMVSLPALVTPLPLHSVTPPK